MLCLAPRSCSYSDMCWPWRRREEPLSRQRSEKRHYLLPQGNTGARGNSAFSRWERESEYERERGSKQVPEKAVCVLSRAKKGWFSLGWTIERLLGPAHIIIRVKPVYIESDTVWISALPALWIMQSGVMRCKLFFHSLSLRFPSLTLSVSLPSNFPFLKSSANFSNWMLDSVSAYSSQIKWT